MPENIVVDVDPGQPFESYITLDMIARSDAAGLERAIQSALPHVDAILVGIDGRSDTETREMAERYADVVWSFDWKSTGLDEAAWAKNRIHFGNTRNLGRRQVKTPWALFLDTDEHLFVSEDLRELVRKSSATRATYPIRVVMSEAISHEDSQRLARAEFHWVNETHNGLAYMDTPDAKGPLVDGYILHDVSLRSKVEVARRDAQRAQGMDLLPPEADKGHVGALFHLVKQRYAEAQVLYADGKVDESAAKLKEAANYATEYRSRVLPHGPYADDRAYTAATVALGYYQTEDFVSAEQWAHRALLDGPRVEPFCLLGDIAEDRDDYEAALIWYEAACITPAARSRTRWGEFIQKRWGRLAALRQHVNKPHPRADDPAES